ncbi:MAG: glycosyltransferase family 2 protein [Chitinophagaceae bacterium]
MADIFPSVAVVILNWNGRPFLEKFLPSVTATDYPDLKIYVADNASEDDSVKFVMDHYPQINIIQNSGNFGFAGGYNEALKKVSADYYVLLNSDVEVDKDWILPIIQLMNGNPVIGACQPKILSYNQRNQFEYAGAAGGWMDRWGFSFCRGRIFDTMETDKGQYDHASKVFWASGAAFFIKADLYRRAGGLDEYFFAHMEEIDLCWRLQRMGYQIWCCPQSVVYHVGGGSLAQGDPYKMFLNFRNNLIMMHKNLSGFERFSTLVIRFTLDGFAALRSIFKGYRSEVKIILKAHGAYYRWLFQKKKQHHSPNDIRLPVVKMKDLSGIYFHTVAWKYFAKGKQAFSSLKIENK